MDAIQTIREFDLFLKDAGLRFDGVIAGGAALALLGIISRPTRDCDVIHPELPAEIADAARRFARMRSAQGDMLDDNWLNNHAMSVTDSLPAGWIDRLESAYRGCAVRLRSLGRQDLLRTKVFALCDRALDLTDCMALKPTVGELDAILPWLEAQDGNPDWPNHVRAILEDLKRRLGHVL